MGVTWFSQFSAALKRNFLVKIRDGSQTLQEVFLPVYIVFLLIIVKLLRPEISYPEVPLQDVTNVLCYSSATGEDFCFSEELERQLSEDVLAFVPDSPTTAQLARWVSDDMQSSFPTVGSLQPQGFPSEADLLHFYAANPQRVFAALVFDNVQQNQEALPPKLECRIRINGTYMPAPRRSADKSECRGSEVPCQAHKYLTSGFVALQTSLARAVAALSPGGELRCSNSTEGQGLGVSLRQQALPAYKDTFATSSFRLFCAMYMVWALAPVLQISVTHLVHEKETLVKDHMLLVGLAESVYWLSWGAVYGGMAGVTAGVLVGAAKWSGLFGASSAAALFVTLWLYCVSLLALAACLSALLASVRSAAGAAWGLLLVASLLIVPLDLLGAGTATAAFGALLSPVGLALAIDVLVWAEAAGVGIHMSRGLWARDVGIAAGEHPNPLSLGALMGFFLLDTVLYAALAWYLYQVWSHPVHGARRPWNFLCKGIRKRGQDPAAAKPDAWDAWAADADDRLEVLDDESEHLSPAVEPVPPELARQAAVVLRRLRKEFPGKGRRWWQLWAAREPVRRRASLGGRRGDSAGGAVAAVQGLNLTLYEGQCFAFLGHSGAGKSVLLSMLAGITAPSRGAAYIYGHRADRLRTAGEPVASIGYCPQHNVAISWLTVAEQLRFFAAIRGEVQRVGRSAAPAATSEAPAPASAPAAAPGAIPSSWSASAAADEVMRELGLTADAERRASELTDSGQRLLSLAIALVGRPQVLLLDAPTAALDAPSRKAVWDTLYARRAAGAVVVVATQSMEEADVLAERKAVLSHGALKCCGSSLFLRSAFGLTYLLHVAKRPEFRASQVAALVQQHIPDAVLAAGASVQAQAQTHVSFRIPQGRPRETSALLMELTARAGELGVAGVALEGTTMEEVFLHFQEEGEDEASALSLDLPDPGASAGEEEQLLGPTELSENSANEVHSRGARANVLLQQVTALSIARFKLYWRNLGSAAGTFGVPAVLALFVLGLQLAYRPGSPQAVALVDERVGSDVPLFYTVGGAGGGSSSSNSSAEAAQLAAAFGDNRVRLSDTRALAERLDLGNGSVAVGAEAVGLDLQRVDFAACRAVYTLLYQPWLPHQLPALVAAVDSAFLESVVHRSVAFVSHPLPFLTAAPLFAFLVSLVIAMGLLLTPPVLAAQVVADRECGMRAILRLSGLRGVAFWMAHALTDVLLYVVVALLILVAGLLVGRPPFVPAAGPALALLFLLALPSNCALAFWWSGGFAKSDAAASELSLSFLLLGTGPYLVWLLLDVTWQWTAHVLLAFLNPPYALVAGLHYATAMANAAVATGAPQPWLSWRGGVLPCLVGATVSMLFFGGLLWRRERAAGRRHNAQLLAADSEGDGAEGGASFVPASVVAERERVRAGLATWEEARLQPDGDQEGELVLCAGLGKVYSEERRVCLDVGEAVEAEVALRDIWLAVARGEVVVLVGAQESGKSSLLLCLAGLEPVSSGDAFVAGNSVRTHMHCVTSGGLLGLCPEGDVLYGSLTAAEHLELVARIKRVRDPRMAVAAVLAAVGLSAEEAGARVVACKPGVLRRVSVAAALLGNPQLLLVDQPSQGMDSLSRRLLWARLRAEARTRAVIVVTQSVEEAEALGTRVGFLVDGELRCIGTPQDLKASFGNSYSLHVSAPPAKMRVVRAFITTLFPQPPHEEELFEPSKDVGENIDGHARFRVPLDSLAELAMLLHELEAKRASLGISQYTVSQPTLRQVFSRLSR